MNSTTKLIYILEDNDDIREILELLLTADHYEVVGFPDVSSFRKGLLNQVPNTFILDVMLPDGNGIDVCCELKADKSTSDIPVIMMSANYTSEQMSGLCSAEDFISKPFDILDFSRRVASQIDTDAR
ncbi:response regulator transcription factor [Pedobacter endophyticus]|uniref:Response regulator n=1 Tax=Pedobacter endophyticus TaxID=2789740 RepID=A0A7S9L178_9SPHI|nr:response regulator [Pedobacter endophyticus]QPH40607.1 response regulator [Pedobacter endophyticus]